MADKHQQYKYYITDGSLDMPLVRGGGLYVMRSFYHQSPHVHEDYEFVYIMAGEVGWSLGDGSTFHLRGGDISLVQPNTLHGWEFDIVHPASFMWLSINPSAPDALKHNPLDESDLCTLAEILKQSGNMALHGDHRMNGLFKETRRVLADCRDKNETTSKAWLRILIGQWILLLQESLKRREKNTESPEIAAVRSYIEFHFDDVISLQQLSVQAGMSEGWFSERFAREVGLTPIDYLNRVRCTKAQKMLCNTSLSITDIAFRIGFSSSHYFSNCFKRYLGVSPSEYRSSANQTK